MRIHGPASIAACLVLLQAIAVPAQVPIWNDRYGDESPQVPTSIALGPDNGIVIAGSFSGVLDLGGAPLISAGEYDIFLALFNAEGQHIWSRSFGDASNDKARDLAVSAEGDILLSGDFFQTIDFGGGPLISEGDKDAFLARFDLEGNHVWSQGFGDAQFQSASAVAFDTDGNAILGGNFRGSIDLGGGSLDAFDAQDIFIACFDAGGGHLWSQSFAGFYDQWIMDLDTDGFGGFALAGSFAGSLDWGDEVQVAMDGQDAYQAHFDAAGLLLWSSVYGGAGNQIARAVVDLGLEGTVLAGDFESSIDLAGEALISAGGTDLFLARFDPGGQRLWSGSFGDEQDQGLEALSAGPAEDISITGWAEGAPDFGGGPLPTAGSMDIFLARYNGEGGHLWSAVFGDGQEQRGQGLAIDALGDLVLGAWFMGSVDLGAGPLFSSGSADIVLAKFGAVTSATPPTIYPMRLSLHPNPFNPKLTLQWTLRRSGRVTVQLLDLRGRVLRTLFEEHLATGPHSASFLVGDLPSGIYLCRVTGPEGSAVRKTVLLK